MQQFLRQNSPDFIAADEWASYSPYLNPLDYCIWNILQDLVHEGRRLPFANLRDLKKAVKTNGRRSLLRQFEKSIAQLKNDCIRLESRMKARFSTISANCCDWLSISCSEMCWTYWLFCTFRTPDTFVAYFTVKTKTYNVIVQQYCSLEIVFVWILLLSSTTSLHSVGRFYGPPGIFYIISVALSYARARLTYRQRVRPSVCPSIRLSHALQDRLRTN